MSTIKGSSLRIGGLNSGLDTEAIVKAMSAGTKLRITTNQRQVLKLQAQQEAYRSIIGKFTGFKAKYLDILNGNTFLGSRSTFNRHTATVSKNGVEQKLTGINVTTNSNATAGSYKVTVDTIATQANISSKPTDSLNTVFEPDKYQNSSTYAMTMTVGGVTKVIAFQGNTDPDEVTKSINSALVSAFGKTNTTDIDGRGLVYFDATDGKFVSTEKKTISTGLVSELGDQVSLGNEKTWLTGDNNSITVIIAGEVQTVTLQTLGQDYFDGFTIEDKDGTWAVAKRVATAADAMSLFGIDSTADWDKLTQSQQDARIAEAQKDFNAKEKMLNDILFSMYNKERFAEFQDWQGDSTLHDGKYNPDYWQISLDRDEILAAYTANGVDVSSIDPDPDNLTLAQFNTALVAARNAEVAARADLAGLTGTERTKFITDETKKLTDEINSDQNAALLTKIRASMSDEQIALFDEELVRRNTALKQQDYTAAVNKAYDDFYKWQRDELGIQVGSGNFMMINEWKEMLGISDTMPATGSWADVFPAGDDMKQIAVDYYTAKEADALTQIAGLNADILALNETDLDYEENKKALEDQIAALQDIADRNNARLDYWGGVSDSDFSDAVDIMAGVFTDAQSKDGIDELMFLRGGYSERDAYFNRYAEQPGQSYNDFLATASAMGVGEFSSHFNETTLNQRLGNINFADGTKVEASISATGDVTLSAYKLAADGVTKEAVDMAAYAGEDSKNDFGLETAKTIASTISTSTRLSELGLTPENGNYILEINGEKLTFNGNTTIREMMNAVNNNAKINVNMTFSSLTNTFEIKSKEYGTAAEITFGDDPSGLFAALGFDAYVNQTVNNGTNLRLDINGQIVETASNSYEINGTVITVGENAQVGESFLIEVERDTSQVANIIKDFIKDYNELIDFVYGFVNEKPEKDYYFLTDYDREELGLTESQEKKWEEKASKGLLYNDRAITDIMSRMRVALFSGVPRGDDTMFGLYSMGISTHQDWKQNGKLVIQDEERFLEAIEKDIDMIAELFTNTENGLMPQINSIIDSAIKTTGERWEKGLFIQKAGLANTSSATDNAINDQIKRLNDMISNLEYRYQKQQDRYWSIFTALEKQMGQLNGQSDYIGQMLGSSMWGGNK
ncbi:MAG: flagellar filament capping protein FliD [Oscillospiraceae bacterium]|nr:flagellar filament capping protein FliD [Oscillospiraceae bacterium]